MASALSHLTGALLAIAALVLLVVKAARIGNAWHIVSSAIFGATMIMLFLSSTMTHWLKQGKAKDVFFTVDQIAIFTLIAGTYTPFTLVALHGPFGWVIFGLEWGPCPDRDHHQAGPTHSVQSRGESFLHSSLCGYGVDGIDCDCPNIQKSPAHGRSLDPDRRILLHHRDLLLSTGPFQIPPPRLAPPGHSRRRLPLFRDILLFTANNYQIIII